MVSLIEPRSERAFDERRDRWAAAAILTAAILLMAFLGHHDANRRGAGSGCSGLGTGPAKNIEPETTPHCKPADAHACPYGTDLAESVAPP